MPAAVVATLNQMTNQRVRMGEVEGKEEKTGTDETWKECSENNR